MLRKGLMVDTRSEEQAKEVVTVVLCEMLDLNHVYGINKPYPQATLSSLTETVLK